MVISSTNAVDESIHAVSPELIFAPSTSSGLVGAGVAAGAAAGAGATGAAAGAAAGLSWAMTGAHQPVAPNMARIANSLFIVVLPKGLPRRFRRCGCGSLVSDRR